jgi:hypothetical protein
LRNKKYNVTPLLAIENGCQAFLKKRVGELGYQQHLQQGKNDRLSITETQQGSIIFMLLTALYMTIWHSSYFLVYLWFGLAHSSLVWLTSFIV